MRFAGIARTNTATVVLNSSVSHAAVSDPPTAPIRKM